MYKRISGSNSLKLGRVDGSEAKSLADKAYEQIRDGILHGKLAVGDILSRRRLADELNMSFLPITEALQRLESEGLVESRPRIGTRIRIPTPQDIRDSYILREALETQAARLCCQNMTPEERDQLLLSAQHLDTLYSACIDEAEDSQFLFSVHTYHMNFHLRVAELSRSAGLLKAIEREQVLVSNWLYDVTVQMSVPEHFHSSLANELCSGDVGRADEAMRQHIQYRFQNVLEGVRALEVSKGWRHKRRA